MRTRFSLRQPATSFTGAILHICLLSGCGQSDAIKDSCQIAKQIVFPRVPKSASLPYEDRECEFIVRGMRLRCKREMLSAKVFVLTTMWWAEKRHTLLYSNMPDTRIRAAARTYRAPHVYLPKPLRKCCPQA